MIRRIIPVIQEIRITAARTMTITGTMMTEMITMMTEMITVTRTMIMRRK